jgi:uncharacterized protein
MIGIDLARLSAERAYQGFYVPHYELRIAGDASPERVIRDIVQITYKDNVKDIDSVDITLNNWDPEGNRYKYIGSDRTRDLPGGGNADPLASLFEPGITPFELRLGYIGALSLVSTVTISSMEPSFASSGPGALQVRGLNTLHKFRTKQHSHAWTAQKPSAIARDIGRLSDRGTRRLPIPVEISNEALAREHPIPYLAQDNMHDIDFLLGLARKVGYSISVVPRSRTRPEHLSFAPSQQIIAAQELTLIWGQSLIDFKPRISTTRQVAKVTVQGWDRARKRPIKVTVDLKDREVRRINPNLHRLVEAAGGQEEISVNEPVFTESDARQRARAIMTDTLKQMVKAEGTTVGLPGLRAGSTVNIFNLGARLSGRYFVEETTHSFSDAGYTTKFKAHREDPRV